MSAFKLISFLFPFLKEMMLGEKTVREAFKTNKMRVVMLGLILLVFFGFAVTVPKLIRISADYVMLERKYHTLETQCEAIHCDAPASEAQTHPAVKPPRERKEHTETPHVSVEAPPVASYPSVPDPIPEKDTRIPAVDTAPAPNRREHREQHSSQPHPRSSAGNSPEATARYNEWKRSFDEIKAQDEARAAETESRDSRNLYNSITNNSDLYRHP